jgi:hypothetical protein
MPCQPAPAAQLACNVSCRLSTGCQECYTPGVQLGVADRAVGQGLWWAIAIAILLLVG